MTNPGTCPCIVAEKRQCGKPDCFHFGGKSPCGFCGHTGRVGVFADLDEARRYRDHAKLMREAGKR